MGRKQDQQQIGGYTFTPNATYHELKCNDRWLAYRDAAYHDYRRQWSEVPEKKIELPFPLHLDIETTNVCNLRCPMCPRTLLVDNGEFSEQGFMSRDEYRSLIDQGVEHGIKSVKLNYLGEPLAHKEVAWQVRYAKERGVLDVMLNTNASLLDRKRSEALLEAGLDHLFVSFDAIAPDLFEQQRTGTSLGRVIDNLYGFVKLRNDHFPRTHIRVSMVMYKDAAWQEQFEALKVMWRGLVDDIGYGFYTERDRDSQEQYPEVPGFHCAQPFQRMFLKYNGNVTVCCVDDVDETVMGNWRQTPLREIWNNMGYGQFRHLHAAGNYYRIDMCRRCFLPHSD